jgi:hypothetical protein
MYWSLSIIEQLLNFSSKNVVTEIYFMTLFRNVLHSFEFTIFYICSPRLYILSDSQCAISTLINSSRLLSPQIVW